MRNVKQLIGAVAALLLAACNGAQMTDAKPLGLSLLTGTDGFTSVTVSYTADQCETFNGLSATLDDRAMDVTDPGGKSWGFDGNESCHPPLLTLSGALLDEAVTGFTLTQGQSMLSMELENLCTPRTLTRVGDGPVGPGDTVDFVISPPVLATAPAEAVDLARELAPLDAVLVSDGSATGLTTEPTDLRDDGTHLRFTVPLDAASTTGQLIFSWSPTSAEVHACDGATWCYARCLLPPARVTLRAR